MAKIVQVIESFAYGSAKSVKQLCTQLKREHDVTVFYGMRDGTETELRDLDPEIRWIALPGRGSLRHLQNLVYLARHVDADTDFIHGHSTFGGMYVKLVGALFGRATVFYSPRGYSFLREDYSHLKRKVFWWVERLTSRRCETITCGPSEQRLASQLRSRNRNINNGVKIPAEVDVESVGDEILSVGRVSIQKGFDIFKQIAAALPECRFVWMGSAEPADKHLLDDLPNNVTMVDYQPHDVTMERIRRARFVLLPSRWEGLSRVLLESIGFGRAIVTSHCEANVDCLAGPVQGATSRDAFEFDNGYACSHLEDYVAAITQLCSDPQLLRAKQAASLRHARRNFDMELIRRQWKDLYQLPSQSLSPALAPRLTT